MSRRLFIGASIFLLSIPAARAQGPSPESMAVARNLVVTMKLADPYANLLPGILLGLKPALVQDRPEVDRDFDAMMPEIKASFAPYHSAITDALATVYASNFTARELREIEAFYRQPVGQKLVEKSKVLAQQTSQAGEDAVRKVTDDLRKRVAEALRRKGK